MSKTDTKSNETSSSNPENTLPHQLLLELYKAYEPLVDKHLWPWETQRWHELVFCILTAVSKPEMSPDAIRDVTQVLGDVHLLDIDRLGEINMKDEQDKLSNRTLIAIETILLNTGFTDTEAQQATTGICEAARGFQQHFEGKTQKFLRACGRLMLEQVNEKFTFSQLSTDEATRAFSLWFQNALNIPLPTPDHISDEACELLQVEYESLVEAADEVDVNVALLDNVLRDYWQREIEVGIEETVG